MLTLSIILLAAVIAICCALGTILRYDRHSDNSMAATDSLCDWDYFTTDFPGQR